MATDVTIQLPHATAPPEKDVEVRRAASDAEPGDERELQESFARYDQQITINNIKLGCVLGMVLMPAGVILDFFTYPDRPEVIKKFFLFRICCSVLIGVFWMVVRSEVGRRNYRTLGIILALLPAFFISAMIASEEGAGSHYYAGLNLVLLVVGFILHWTLRESLIATGTVLLMYLGACLWYQPRFLTEQREDFANNVYFLVLTGIIVVAGSGYHYRLRFREYALLFELDKNKKELEENHRKLKELDEIKSRFFANISHELRTPLTLLLAPLESLIVQSKNPAAAMAPQMRELLATMQGNGMRLLKLINDLLDLVRLESGRMEVRAEPLDFEAFIRGLVQNVKNVAADKKIRLEAIVGAEVGTVLADRDKWEKILLNLVFNAVKFTPANGVVEVRVEKVEGYLEVKVRDTGMGISKENMEHVFSRFWQADTSAQRKFQGAGIGLALVKELVEVQGGEVVVQSEVNRGTTFTITLPYRAASDFEVKALEAAGPALSPGRGAPTESGTKAEERLGEQWLATLYRRAEFFPSMTSVHDSIRPIEVDSAGKKGPKVLVADDEPDMLRFLKSQLAAQYNVIEAVDGTQAFEKACQFLPDIVLLDMMMPEKDGLQVCRELRTRTSTKRIPIVLLTARADEETKLQALAAGASDFLAKPFSTTELHVRIKNLIDSHEYQRQVTRQNQILEATLEQLKETESQLVQSEKLASLGRMSAGIIHEINNPLNFAKTATHILRRQAKQLPEGDREEYDDTLKDIEEGIDRVRHIVSDLRSFSHPNTEMFEDVAVENLISTTLRFMSHEWKERVDLVQNVKAGATVWGNRHQLIQVLLNLTQNALDALKKKDFGADKPMIEIAGLHRDDKFLLVIRDNGPGIAPENISRIFDPFFTTKDVGEGMGLGLSICYRILEAHGGRITVKSELGQFCEFTLEFPAEKTSEKEPLSQD
ncbi:MAG TPA: ATP-binding protein [Verrucomicrobiae bacterium]